MAKKPKPMQEPVIEQNGDEILITSPFGGAVGVAIRTAEDHKAKTFRMVITIRAGTQPEKIVFNFGNYSGPVNFVESRVIHLGETDTFCLIPDIAFDVDHHRAKACEDQNIFPEPVEILSPQEWEEAKKARAAELFEKSRARKKISPIFTAPVAARDFVSLATKTGEARSMVIMKRAAMEVGGKLVLNKKTKKPRITWVPA